MENKAMIQQVQKRMIISINNPAKKLGIKEGDYVKIEIDEEKKELRISPVDWHDKDQDYFWTEAWQQKVKQSLKDLEEGRVKSHGSMDDLIKELEDAENTKNG
ncbi:AbrB/MazE/SpoVT family DNA-binding domain-containing protein [Desulforamulus ruminis]|uniref:Transcriptional regulator, AbrB family n=1 Tax=Desulforamulus ruminis (strain ATCC 23193 / DSM 2154 / NCIMB 8452 / DL) TaxID=696281 RepID=F6DQ38_DESRL|nr:transcriptional regulator [Desulforamulus ruminis]AEG61982.1 hypothetical protein Desru_3782 [Desulforamulus ruminis DSM 2154]